MKARLPTTRPAVNRRRPMDSRRTLIGSLVVGLSCFLFIIGMMTVFGVGRDDVASVVEKDLGSGLGLGGGLGAVGMNGFDVGKPAKDVIVKKPHELSVPASTIDPVKQKEHTAHARAQDEQEHHQHNEFKAPIIQKNEAEHYTTAVDDLPKAAAADFDAVTDIVQCGTSRGNVTIDVRGAWSPKGAEQFLKLVRLGHFSDLPFTRVAPRYITQFGRKYREPETPDPLKTHNIEVIKDDAPLWGFRDMDFGYVFFAGSGPDSRFDEMVVALCPMKGCIQTGLGHADWETPVATIRKEGFPVLNDIMSSGKPYPKLEMAGQHPKAGGPALYRVMKEKGYLQREYPFIEYWRGCTIHSQDRRLSRPLHIDHPDSKQRQGSQGSKMSTKKVEVVASKDKDKDSEEGESHAVTDSKKNGGSYLRGGGARNQQEDGVYTVKFTVSTVSKGQGEIVFEMHPSWAPLGAARFAELVKAGTFTNARFFRVIKGFMAQFGIPASPHFFEGRDGGGGEGEYGNANGANHSGLPPHDAASVDLKALKSSIHDEDKTTAKIQSNTRGMLTFAHAGKNTRGHQLFINTADNVYLDKEGFPPIGRVVAGMEYVDTLYNAYGEGGKGDGSDGKGPAQGRLGREGNAYLDKYFPKLSYIVKAEVVTSAAGAGGA